MIHQAGIEKEMMLVSEGKPLFEIEFRFSLTVSHKKYKFVT